MVYVCGHSCRLVRPGAPTCALRLPKLHPSVKQSSHLDGLRLIEQQSYSYLFPYLSLYLYPSVRFLMGLDRLNNSAIDHLSCSQCVGKVASAHWVLLRLVAFSEKHHWYPAQSLTSSQFRPSHCIFISAASYAMAFYIGPQGFLGWTNAVKNVWHSDPITAAHPKLGGNAFQIPSLVGRATR